MRRSTVLVAVSLAGLALATAAHAADPPFNWPAAPEVQRARLPITELSSGWYLRGDVGYRFNRAGVPDSLVTITSQSYGNTYVYGGGFGYKYQWFRTDATLDYGARAMYHGNTATVPAFYNGKVSAMTALANVYFDLGTWSLVTPYVGAGIGTSYVNVTDYINVTVPVLIPQAGRWNLSWAAMGGASFRFAPNWALDVGYRYLKLGDATSGDGTLPNNIRFRNLSAHDVRIGFRYLLD